MKNMMFCIFMTLAALGVFAQELTIVVPPFEIRAGFSRDEAETITELFLNELAKYKTVKVVDQSRSSFK
jgi:TolB-like protein